jgi:Domain of unknown function (DUF3127)
MAIYQIKGLVYSVSPVENLVSRAGKPFQKRSLVIDATLRDPHTGAPSQYTNYPSFEFLNEKCALIDGILQGDVVEVHFFVQGDIYVTPSGDTKYITKLIPHRVDLAQKMTVPPPTFQPQQFQQPQGGVYGTPTPMGQAAYSQANYPQQPQGNPYVQQPYQQQQQPPQEGTLPF